MNTLLDSLNSLAYFIFAVSMICIISIGVALGVGVMVAWAYLFQKIWTGAQKWQK